MLEAQQVQGCAQPKDAIDIVAVRRGHPIQLAAQAKTVDQSHHGRVAGEEMMVELFQVDAIYSERTGQAPKNLILFKNSTRNAVFGQCVGSGHTSDPAAHDTNPCHIRPLLLRA